MAEPREQAPLYMYVELDGPGKETRFGRTAQTSQAVDLYAEVEGRSQKIATVTVVRDPDRKFTVLSFSMDGVSHTKTFDGLPKGQRR